MKALYLTKDPEFRAQVAELQESQLPAGNVKLRVEYSTINYKDGLAITNASPIVRTWPMVAGIDGAGVVEASDYPAWRPGDRVILNGWGAGEVHWGCLAQKASLKGEWLVKLPDALTSRQAMAIGTAGYTAMLCAMALERGGVTPEKGEVLVTGAAGGVGSVAIAILAGEGFRVVASTGRPQEAEYLQSLGAAEVIERRTLSEPGKPLQRERWAGVVDSVGSHTLANACAQTQANGVVAACGLAQGMDFPATVAPFILRGVTLAGINSVTAPSEVRSEAWSRLAKGLDLGKLESMTREITLAEALNVAPEILAGRVRGRLVVDVNR
ncbi:MAG TPA: MDR family oxidoreductase [Usitatibacter sp.]|jgi:putative YhdH/YhfP family quinone oxidoreductase|nr:MDR family oxidoreductase [Usitatibacter sp.]